MTILKDIKSNYIFGNYLIQYDLIQKYKLKNIYQSPQIKKIIIYFSVKDLAVFSNVVKRIAGNIQIKAYLIFYILFSLNSYINLEKNSINKFFQKNNEDKYSLKVILSKKEEIYNFLFLLFIENYNPQILNESLKKLNSKSMNKKEMTFKNEVFCYNFSITGDYFFDLNDFFKQNVKEFNLKEVRIKLSFLIEGNKFKCVPNNLLKNLGYFWQVV